MLLTNNCKNRVPLVNSRLFSSCRYIMSSKPTAVAPLSVDTLKSWDHEIKADRASSIAATAIRNQGFNKSFISRDRIIANTSDIFSHVVDPEGSPVTNQKISGRCWLFAATNVLRLKVMKKYDLKTFELSPTFLFFYDKLEKANFFLEQIYQTVDEELEGRLVQHLLTDPVCDGGQFDMFVNIVEKYGLVPNTVFPDTFNSLSSTTLNTMVTTLLRQYAQEIRESVKAGKSNEAVEELKKSQIKEIHRLLTLFLGAPPGPNEPITWEFKDKDKNFKRIHSTPLEFAKEIVEYDPSESVSLLNDPRNTFNQRILIDRLGNVVGKPCVSYLNTDIDRIADLAVSKIKNNEAVFFGTHTPLYHDKATGVIDLEFWDYKLVGFEPNQNKADRLKYHESLMTHAMVFTGVHLDDDGKPLRWRVENSWGEDVGKKGYFTMTHDFFKEYVYQIVVDKKDIPDLVPLLTSEPIVLPPWDPCGALAQ